MNAPADPVAAFCDYYHDYHNITVQRRRMQLRVLREFEEQLPGDVLAVDADQMREYVTWLVRGKGLVPNTVRQYINAIRPFLTWCWEGELISAENLLKLRAVKAPRGASGSGTPHPYEARDLERFWNQLDAAYPWAHDGGRERAEWYVTRWRNGSSRWNRVQRYAKRLQLEAIVALALYGGLRRDEIYNLQLEEMHPDNEYIVVRSRKNREGEERVRGVPWMSEEMNRAVRQWLDFRELIAPGHDGPWLCLHHEKHRCKPMRHEHFAMLLCRLGEGWSLHRMRHTAATIMLRSGMPLDKVSTILGHARLEQTRQYAKVTHTDVVLAARRVTNTFGRAFPRPEQDAA